MEKIINVAQYIFNEYKRVTEEIIDEMKLQKLLLHFLTHALSRKKKSTQHWLRLKSHTFLKR